MAIKLSIKLNNESYNTLGSFKDNIITYYESGRLKSKMTIDLKNKTLKKENIEYDIYLSFKDKKTKNKISLKKENSFIEIEIETIKFIVNDNKVIINYKIIDSKEIVLLEIEGDFR